jgi:hypothetical protein
MVIFQLNFLSIVAEVGVGMANWLSFSRIYRFFGQAGYIQWVNVCMKNELESGKYKKRCSLLSGKFLNFGFATS